MEIRRSVPEDMGQILAIYHHAREQMRLSGNPNQWGTTYPPPELVKEDILNGNSWLVLENGEAAGVFVFAIGDDPTYAWIENGGWLNHAPYGTIHRIASAGRAKGVLRACLQFCEGVMPNIRIDTHERNHAMRHLLEQYGFQECGMIYVEDGSPRIAYQRGGKGYGE